MVVAEREIPRTTSPYDKFGDAMPDGRLTAPANGTIYRIRDIILETRRLGRKLTQSELERFAIK